MGTSTPKIHLIKAYSQYYHALRLKNKTFELRENDRDYRVGDYLGINECDYTGKLIKSEPVIAKITYVLQDVPDFGLKDGFVILGLKFQSDFDIMEKIKIFSMLLEEQKKILNK